MGQLIVWSRWEPLDRRIEGVGGRSCEVLEQFSVDDCRIQWLVGEDVSWGGEWGIRSLHTWRATVPADWVTLPQYISPWQRHCTTCSPDMASETIYER